MCRRCFPLCIHPPRTQTLNGVRWIGFRKPGTAGAGREGWEGRDHAGSPQHPCPRERALAGLSTNAGPVALERSEVCAQSHGDKAERGKCGVWREGNARPPPRASRGAPATGWGPGTAAGPGRAAYLLAAVAGQLLLREEPHRGPALHGARRVPSAGRGHQGQSQHQGERRQRPQPPPGRRARHRPRGAGGRTAGRGGAPSAPWEELCRTRPSLLTGFSLASFL